jgi:parvulin-like peptidyl-prolyl isomerase
MSQSSILKISQQSKVAVMSAKSLKIKPVCLKEVTDVLFGLKEGQMSKTISTTSDYFIIRADKIIDKNRVKASIIRINVKTMNDYLKELKKDKKVTEYISITDDVPEESDLAAPLDGKQ